MNTYWVVIYHVVFDEFDSNGPEPFVFSTYDKARIFQEKMGNYYSWPHECKVDPS